jgi:RHS repeat-associated protein
MPTTDYYMASEAMGSATAILDEDGNVLERRTYDAFGKMTCMAPDGTPVTESPTEVDVGFQGQIRDDVTSLYQMGYRWYSPTLGRWASTDPTGLKGGINYYASFGNTPNTHLDPWGLAWEITPGQGLHYNDRNSAFSFAVDVGQNGELVAKPLKGHTFDAERSSKILKETAADKEGMARLRKMVASAHEEKSFCDKSRLQKLGRALRLAGALGAIASVADSRLPEAARAYLYAKNYNEKMAAATWVASEAVNAHMTEIGALFIYNKLME